MVFIAKNGPDKNTRFKSMIENDFEIVEISPCKSILAKLENRIPDVIIINESFNDPEAYQACQQVKFSDKYHFIPVIFIGPSFSREHRVKLVESGSDDYFEEPFDSEETVSYLKALINKRHNFGCLADKYDRLKKEVSHAGDTFQECLDPDDEELFKATFQQSAVGIAQMSLEGNFLKVNERFCDIVGYTREELLSLNCMDITYPDKKGIEDKMVKKILDGDADSFEIEKRYIHKKGHHVWVKLYTNVTRDDSGNIRNVFSIVADISAQKEAEARLHESEAFFRTMYESSSIGIVKMSVHDKRIEQANAAFCDMLGYEEHELKGKHLRDISFLEDMPENIAQQNKLESGEVSSIKMEKRYIHKSGYLVHALLHANLIFDKQGTPLYYIGNVLDITDIRTSQQRLKESEEKYRAYVDNSPHPIFVTDVFGMLLDVNPAACNLTGYSVEELLDMNIIDLCSPESINAATEHFLRVKEESKASAEFLFLKKDNDTFYMQVEAVMIDEKRILALCVDTTDRKLTEKLLIEAKMLAENASKSKSEFLANISHKLRTPLNIVIGYSDILLSEVSGKLNEKQMKYSTSIKEAGSNLLEIVNSLIYIAEIEGGSRDLNITKFDLQPMVVDLERIFHVTSSKNSVLLEFEIRDDIEYILADKSKLKTILHHLIGNSIKFNKEGGYVKVVFERDGNDIRVQVIDSGIGIPDNEQETLFDPFVQLDWSHARRYDGVGIGLSLVKGLVEMHDGNISLVSEVDEGSTFIFTIPQKQ
ncbi:PAS domain S-box protein [Methanolobus bombayensis]|uniref:PAS domain S-box protein n=1 Tax=Methanolobus bombayensis TaxID=38023 RepID=UPI0031593307